jgi:hypothetical protein
MNDLVRADSQTLLPTDIADVLINGDLAKLSPENKIIYYTNLCKSLGLNPITKPFAYMKLGGKEVLYALKDATDQLRKLYKVSAEVTDTKQVGDVYVVQTKVTMPDGRSDGATGAVNIKGLFGDSLANALMKAETKSKRRATLSICGLGLLDESEIETIPKQAIAESNGNGVEKKKGLSFVQCKQLYDAAASHFKENRTVGMAGAMGEELVRKHLTNQYRKLRTSDLSEQEHAEFLAFLKAWTPEQELDEVERVGKKEVISDHDDHTPPTVQPNPADMITSAQTVKIMKELFKTHDKSRVDEFIKNILTEQFGKTTIKELTKREASEFISYLLEG